jgi:murein DD-endopeptidase MepM/ murein hydrolase activator NlpD
MLRAPAILLATITLAGLALAAPYTVRSGDTLFKIAESHGTTVQEIVRLNGLTSTTIRVGQVLQLPETGPSRLPRQTVSAPGGALRFSLPQAVQPGDPATVTVVAASDEPPVVTWDGEPLVVARFGREWNAVGRELLGTPAKDITVTVSANGATANATIRLVPSSLGRAMTLALKPSVVAELNDENRAREAAVLNKAYALRTPPAWTKPFIKPVNSGTVSAFGSARRYTPNGPINYHYGEDMPAPSGTPIRATNDGTVVIAGTIYGIRGGLVAIDHGAGITSLYFHQSKFNSRVGQKVQRGDVIGFVGSTGLSTGPHLHWEMRVKGEATDPLQWVGKLWP